MAITEVGNDIEGGQSATPQITHGLTINADDVLVIEVFINGPNTITDTSSVTLVDDSQESLGAAEQYAIFSRIAGGSEPSVYTFSANSSRWQTVIRVFDGCNVSSEAAKWDVTPSASTSAQGTSTTATAPAMTTSVDNTMGIFFVFADTRLTTVYSAPTNSYGTAVATSGQRDSSTFIVEHGTAGSETASCTVAPSTAWGAIQVALAPEAAAGVTVNVPAGALTLTGQAPVAALGPLTIDIPAGALLLTGQAPDADISVVAAVPAGSLSLSGFAPFAQITVPIPVGSLLLTGFAPTADVGDPVTVDVPAGTLSLSGFAPSAILTDNIIVDIPAGSMSLTGQVPVLAFGPLSVDVPAGSLSLTGFAPSITAEGIIWTVQPDEVTSWAAQANISTTWTVQ